MAEAEAEACHNNRVLAEEARKGSFVVAYEGEAPCMVRMVLEVDDVQLELAEDAGAAEDVVGEEHKDQYPAEENQ